MTTQIEKAHRFRALHTRAGAFIIPNPWDIGSARVLGHLGFEALATTSAGFAFLLGKPDTTQEDIAEVVRSVDRPVNVVMGLRGAQLSLAALAAMGVKRVSVGGSLCRTAFAALLRAGREMQTLGTFTYATDAVSHHDMNALFTPGGG